MRALRILTALLTLGLIAGVATAQEPKEASEELTGVKVGEKAPEFTLKDQKGEERSLSSFVKSGKTAVVFYRSASW